MAGVVMAEEADEGEAMSPYVAGLGADVESCVEQSLSVWYGWRGRGVAELLPLLLQRRGLLLMSYGRNRLSLRSRDAR